MQVKYEERKCETNEKENKKIIGLIIIFLILAFIIFSIAYNEDIKYLIKQEEKIEEAENEILEFCLDNEYKFKIDYKQMNTLDSHTVTEHYIDLEKGIVISYYKTINYMADLQNEGYSKQIITLNAEETIRLGNLISRVLAKNKETEEPYNYEYLISTMKQKNVVMNNKEEIESLLKILKINYNDNGIFSKILYGN